MQYEGYRTETYNILKQTLVKIIEDDGAEWFPLKDFLKKIYFKEYKTVSKYRDDEFYSQHMRVFKWQPVTKKQEVKGWCMDKEGVFVLLSKQSLIREDADNINITMKKEEYLATARAMFGVKDAKDNLTYISFAPDISNYDIWSYLVIINDVNIPNQCIWKRCRDCGYYYPYTGKYFTLMHTGRRKSICHQCEGKSFVCDNRQVDFIYKHGGLDLLYELYISKDNDKIIRELKKWLNI